MKIELSPEAKEARRAYKRAWYAANKDKVREEMRRHWEQKAKTLKLENPASEDDAADSNSI